MVVLLAFMVQVPALLMGLNGSEGEDGVGSDGDETGSSEGTKSRPSGTGGTVANSSLVSRDGEVTTGGSSGPGGTAAKSYEGGMSDASGAATKGNEGGQGGGIGGVGMGGKLRDDRLGYGATGGDAGNEDCL
jgi:hypothetical protein